ncbi:neprilysin-1-like [Ornithodoros turicata]|uniref:neprilysin-1-like n=1 Tax=Ornithodoros turicata TaxID=34597 RepID=UPI003139FB55
MSSRSSHHSVPFSKSPSRTTPRSSKKDLDNMKMMLQSVTTPSQTPTPDPSSRSNRRTIILGRVGVVLLVLSSCYLLSYFVRKYISSKDSNCKNEACTIYTDLIANTINRDLEPCQDFYQYVCDGWLKRRQNSEHRTYPVLRDILATFQDAVAGKALFRGTFDSKDQTPYQKAALFYQSCTSNVFWNSELQEMKRLLRAAGISWPHAVSDVDVLKPILMLTVIANANAVFMLNVGKLHGRPAVMFAPDPCFEALARRSTHPQYAKFFDTVVHTFKDSNATVSASFKETRNIQQTVDPEMVKAFRNPDTTSEVSTDDLHEYTPIINQTRWSTSLPSYLNLPQQGITLVKIRNVRFFRAFFNITADIGEDKMMTYVSTYVAERFYLFLDREPCQQDFANKGDNTDGIGSRRFCIIVTDLCMGYALYQRYVDDSATPDVVRDVTSMIGNIHRSLNTSLMKSKFRNYTLPAEVSESAFEFVERTRTDYLEQTYRNYSSMTTNMMVNWNVAFAGLRASSQEDVVPPPFIVDHVPVLYTVRAHQDDFVLSPYSFDIPVYDINAPLAVRYGALGSGIGTALGELLVRRYATWENDTLIELDAKVKCLFGGNSTIGTLSRADLKRLYRVFILDPLWNAYESAQLRSSASMAHLADFTRQMLFFVMWCYLHCGSEHGRDDCNLPLKHSSNFADTFRCKTDSPMAVRNKCEMFT